MNRLDHRDGLPHLSFVEGRGPGSAGEIRHPGKTFFVSIPFKGWVLSYLSSGSRVDTLRRLDPLQRWGSFVATQDSDTPTVGSRSPSKVGFFRRKPAVALRAMADTSRSPSKVGQIRSCLGLDSAGFCMSRSPSKVGQIRSELNYLDEDLFVCLDPLQRWGRFVGRWNWK